MSRPLRGGLRRLFPDHRSAVARAYRAHYLHLAEQFGPFPTGFLAGFASRVASAYVRALDSSRDLAQARAARERGRGRRPSAADVRRLAKRSGLDEGSYDAMLASLRELAVENGHGQDLASRLMRTAKDRP